MKKTICIFVFALAIIGLGKAQNLIAIDHNGTTSFENVLDSAISHAQSGDTIYIPGGSFNLNKYINKRLHIVGVGYNADSSAATNYTFISSPLNLIAGADGGSICGISLPNGVKFGNTSYSGCPSNYTISKCYVGSICSWGSYSYQYSPVNNTFIENIIDNVLFAGGQSNIFFNNIINSITDIGSYNVLKNNVFLAANWPLSSRLTNSNIDNNIFIGTSSFNVGYSSYDFANNVINNNLFVDNISFPFNSSNIGSNNIVNQTQSSIFINQTGSVFNYSHDYHLKSTCPGKNAGTDGTDIGIYGGSYPWKEGSIPFNPHIQYKKINAKTNSNGTLPVQIKVKAQDN